MAEKKDAVLLTARIIAIGIALFILIFCGLLSFLALLSPWEFPQLYKIGILIFVLDIIATLIMKRKPQVSGILFVISSLVWIFSYYEFRLESMGYGYKYGGLSYPASLHFFGFFLAHLMCAGLVVIYVYMGNSRSKPPA